MRSQGRSAPARAVGILWACGLVWAGSSCASRAPRSEIEGVLLAYEAAYNAHDARALAQVHCTDGCYAPASRPLIEGHAALEEYWSGVAARDLDLELHSYDTRGDIGWALGSWQFPAKEGARPIGGRFLLALRREGGRWRIAVDINNAAR